MLFSVWEGIDDVFFFLMVVLLWLGGGNDALNMGV